VVGWHAREGDLGPAAGGEQVTVGVVGGVLDDDVPAHEMGQAARAPAHIVQVVLSGGRARSSVSAGWPRLPAPGCPRGRPGPGWGGDCRLHAGRAGHRRLRRTGAGCHRDPGLTALVSRGRQALSRCSGGSPRRRVPRGSRSGQRGPSAPRFPGWRRGCAGRPGRLSQRSEHHPGRRARGRYLTADYRSCRAAARAPMDAPRAVQSADPPSAMTS